MAVIVVADDEFLLAQMLADLLEDEGHEVFMAQNGRKALDLVRRRGPALLVTDFMMPMLNGMEVATEIRADPALHDLPIVLVTGAQGGIARDRSDLFDAVLDKPYSHDALLEVVARLLERGRGTGSP